MGFLRRSTGLAAEAALTAVRKDTRLAVCAILLELAHAGSELGADERRHLCTAVRQQFGLDAARAEELLRLAEEVRARTPDLCVLTSLVVRVYSLEQTLVLAEIMRGLVRSDGRLTDEEAYLIRRISSLLRLESEWA